MIVSAQSRSSGGSACLGSMPCSCERFVAAWSSGKYGTSGRAGRLSSPGLRGSEYAPIEWTLYPSEESRRTWSNSSMLCHSASRMFTGSAPVCYCRTFSPRHPRLEGGVPGDDLGSPYLLSVDQGIKRRPVAHTGLGEPVCLGEAAFPPRDAAGEIPAVVAAVGLLADVIPEP